MTWAFVFPGQGSQTVGMGQELAAAFPAARAVFDEVDDALGQDLSRLMFEGPAETLTLTENAQPALMAVSLAVVRVLAAEGNVTVPEKAAFVAGHSLGEYSALTAADALGLADCARLLKLRGQAMQAAVPVGAGAMAAVLGLDVAQLEAIAAEASDNDEICAAANDNAPGQVVISGHKAAVERAVELAKAAGAKRAVLLSVSAPFHCPLMAPAADRMAAALAEVAMQSPQVPLMANVTAQAERDPTQIKSLLVQQVTGMVRWRESVMALATAGVGGLVELGAGKVLSGLTRRIDGALTSVNAGSPAEIEALLERLNS